MLWIMVTLFTLAVGVLFAAKFKYRDTRLEQLRQQRMVLRRVVEKHDA